MEISDMVVIDTAANYFKHHHEWPEDWQDSTGTGVQHRTMADARLLGMGGHDLTSNMYAALRALKIGTDSVFTVPMAVHDWRERLATKLSKDLGLLPIHHDES
jgi:predicted RNA-binding protein Jag